jgi:hypothetical protein
VPTDNERLARLEERFVAERSIRRTHADQTMKRFDEFEARLTQVSSGMEEIKLRSQHTETSVVRQEEATEALTEAVRLNTNTLLSIEGSIKTIKWLWPVLMVLISSLITLFIQNTSLTTRQQIQTEVTKKVSVEAPKD